jgi:RimJ/RimL family protein N-acetyltransferase
MASLLNKFVGEARKIAASKYPSMQIIYHTTTRDFERLCALGRKHRLYAAWGTMQTWYQTPEHMVTMAVAYDSDTPIGMAVLRKQGYGSDYGRFGVFVKSYMRRQGIGRRLVALVKKRSGQRFLASKLYPEQREFFDALGMRGYR